jgi:hypothetical protein
VTAAVLRCCTETGKATSVDGTWPLTWWTIRGRIRTTFSQFRDHP